MKAFAKITLVVLAFTSCQPQPNQETTNEETPDSTAANEKAEAGEEKPETAPALAVDDQVLLEYVNCDSCGFAFLKDTEYGDVTFYGRLKVKNASGQSIRKAVFDMRLAIEYKSGFISHVEITPGTNGSYRYITGLKGEWTEPEKTAKYAHISEWEPGAVKTFAFYAGMPKNKMTGDEPYKRTPEMTELRPQLQKLRALDHEFDMKSLESINVLNFWKQQQRALGYRE